MEKKFIIIIENSLGGTKYNFKLAKNYKNLKIGTIYTANYKLIKFCSEIMWEKINKSL